MFGIVMGMGTAASFAVAGALVEMASWRWVMLINVPLGLLVALGVIRAAPRGPTTRRPRIGAGTAILITAAMGLLVVGFDRSSLLGWGHPMVLTFLTSAVVLLGLFGYSLRRSAQPLIPPHLLSDRQRSAAFFAVFIVGIAMFVGMFILTTFMQDVLGYSALVTGLAFLPYGLSAVITSQMLATVSRRLAPGSMLAVGLLVAAAAIASFLLLKPDSTYATGVLLAMLLLGAGGTIVMVTGSNAATLKAGVDSGVASAVVNAGQQAGAARGTALLTSIMAATYGQSIGAGATDLEAMIAGYGNASVVGSAIITISAVVVLAITRRLGASVRT